jgi:hypothetical protein
VLPDASFGDAVTVDGHDRIVAAGGTGSGDPNKILVARYKENGKLDRSFSGDGFTKTQLQEFDSAQSVAIDRSNRIVVAGFAEGTDSEFFGLVRYTPAGTLNHAFGNRGIDLGPSGIGVIRLKG